MIILPEAEADLEYARDWYEQQRNGLGAEFLLAMEEALDRIGRTPHMNGVVHQNIRRGLTRRFPYAVYYRIEGDEVHRPSRRNWRSSGMPREAASISTVGHTNGPA